MLIAYRKFEPDVEFAPKSSHRITFTHQTLHKSQQRCVAQCADPEVNLAYLFKNMDHDGQRIVPDVNGAREMILVDGGIYRRLTRKDMGMSPNGSGLKSTDKGRVVWVLKFMGLATDFKHDVTADMMKLIKII